MNDHGSVAFFANDIPIGSVFRFDDGSALTSGASGGRTIFRFTTVHFVTNDDAVGFEMGGHFFVADGQEITTFYSRGPLTLPDAPDANERGHVALRVFTSSAGDNGEIALWDKGELI